jgi:class 3 adenylate cyclase
MSDIEALLAKLNSKPRFSELREIWRQHNEETWRLRPEIYLRLGRAFIKQAEYLLGLDALTAGLKHSPGPAIRQQQALAFAGTGATDRARSILEGLRQEGYQDGETLGILARTYKDSWRLSGDADHLTIARNTYREAYNNAREKLPPDHGGAFYNGINAATMSFFLGETAEARHTAAETRWHCEEQLKEKPNDPDYWAVATLGEACLLLSDFDAAKEHYTAAAKIGTGNLRDLASTRRQAREILKKCGRDPRELDSCFQIGPVLVFSGHMIDTEARRGKPKRFPSNWTPAVTSALQDVIGALAPNYGYSSAACGSDILFLKVLKREGIAASVVLPFGRKEFAETSVGIGGEEWSGWYTEILEWVGKDRIHEISQSPLVFSSASYDYANMVLQGMAAIYADKLDTELIGLAVWDGQPGDGPGGTASIVARWLAAGLKVKVIHPSGKPLDAYQRPALMEPHGDTRIIAVLFADVVHFSQMTETQMPLFKEEFLPVVAEIVKRRGEPLLKNTWGDGLFFAFRDLREAGLFALDLQRAIARKCWRDLGLPETLNLRIGLHAGPAYECQNPVTERMDFLGYHVSRGARIEPRTATGQIYCSQEFAALVRAAGNDDFAFEYAGRIELPKDAGVTPLYNLRLSSHSSQKERSA